MQVTTTSSGDPGEDVTFTHSGHAFQGVWRGTHPIGAGQPVHVELDVPNEDIVVEPLESSEQAPISTTPDGRVAIVGVLDDVDELGVATLTVGGSVLLVDMPAEWVPVERGTTLEVLAPSVDVYPVNL